MVCGDFSEHEAASPLMVLERVHGGSGLERETRKVRC